nr:MAG TPA: hypothetical protein [Caudoviricetes sp.]
MEVNVYKNPTSFNCWSVSSFNHNYIISLTLKEDFIHEILYF